MTLPEGSAESFPETWRIICGLPIPKRYQVLERAAILITHDNRSPRDADIAALAEVGIHIQPSLGGT